MEIQILTLALDASSALQAFHVCRSNSGRNALQTWGDESDYIASLASSVRLFDISCAGGYLIVNRINVGRRTRYSPYVFENMMFWCEAGDRLGSSVRFQEP